MGEYIGAISLLGFIATAWVCGGIAKFLLWLDDRKSKKEATPC